MLIILGYSAVAGLLAGCFALIWAVCGCDGPEVM